MPKEPSVGKSRMARTLIAIVLIAALLAMIFYSLLLTGNLDRIVVPIWAAIELFFAAKVFGSAEFWLAIAAAVAAIASAFAALRSKSVAKAANKAARTRANLDFFLRVTEILESKELFELKKEVYAMSAARDSLDTHEPDAKEKLRTFLTKLDIVASLANQSHLNEKALMDMYGDVILRTFYIGAPLILELVEERGNHHLMPIRRFVPKLHSMWKNLAEWHEVPNEIGIPGDPRTVLTPQNYFEECKRACYPNSCECSDSHTKQAAIYASKPFRDLNQKMPLTEAAKLKPSSDVKRRTVVMLPEQLRSHCVKQ